MITDMGAAFNKLTAERNASALHTFGIPLALKAFTADRFAISSIIIIIMKYDGDDNDEDNADAVDVTAYHFLGPGQPNELSQALIKP